MIYSHVKLDDIQGSVLELNDLLRIDCTGHNLRAFETLWDEALLVMGTDPDEMVSESLSSRKLEKSDQVKGALALRLLDCVQRSEPKIQIEEDNH